MTKISAKSAAPSSACTAASKRIQLVCPVDSMATLRTAIDNGADWIRLEHGIACTAHGHATPALNKPRITRAIQYAHDRRRNIALNLDVLVAPEAWSNLCALIEEAAHAGIDAIILSDPALMLHCLSRHPDLPVHYIVSVEAMSGQAIVLLQRRFGISRVMLPRTATIAQIAEIAMQSSVDVEVFAFGPRCAADEARHANGLPPMRWHSVSRHPTTSDTEAMRVAGPEAASNDSSYSTAGPTDSSALKLLPRLTTMGVHAIRIGVHSGRADHLAHMTRIWREAIDSCSVDVDHYTIKPSWTSELDRMARQPVVL